MKKILIAPSILSADFGNLNREIKEIEPLADLIHVDVMDGCFVPNITFGQAVLKKIKSKKKMDVHLMINKPERYVAEFAKAGAKIISFHVEATKNPKKTIALIKKAGARAAIAIKPKTSVKKIAPYLELVDFVLVMTVEPGFGGQKFMEKMLPKIKKIRAEYPKIDIEVDGGIDSNTAKKVVAAGANILVAGSAIFGKKNRKKAVQDILKNAKAN